MSTAKRFSGIWSATPTPLRDDGTLDSPALSRLVAHHQKLKVDGLFLGGTCGEGPWLRDGERRELVRTVGAEAAGNLRIAGQGADNSAARILDQIDRAREDGAEVAIMAEPYFLLNATPENLNRLVTDVAKRSSLPLGLYNRGQNAKVPFPQETAAALCQLENLVLVKDSSLDPAFRQAALAARAANPGLSLLNGDEFQCAAYLQAGYDGLMLGGSIFNGAYARKIAEAVAAGDTAAATAYDEALKELNFAVYGGPKITCWLSGLKYLMVRPGVFPTWTNSLNYPLTPECRAAIDRLVETDAIFTPRLTPTKDA